MPELLCHACGSSQRWASVDSKGEAGLIRTIVTMPTSTPIRRGTYLYLIDGGQFESCFGDFFQVFNIAKDFA
jgi:hypothetical protein